MSSDGNDNDASGATSQKPARARRSRRPKKPKRAKTTVEMIDKLLLQPVDVAVAGRSRRVTTLEAILFRLWQKEVLGDTRALKVRLKYQDFARGQSKPRIETIFLDNEYTTAFAAVPLKKGEGDE